MTEQFAEVNGIKICYEISGKEDGYPVFLIHGFGAKKEGWIAQVGPLGEKFKVIRMDNRGAGKSDRPNEPYSMEMFADDIAGLMDHLKIEKAHIIGWSLGGMIVQHFVLKYPERVNKIVLINTNYKGVGGEHYAKTRHDSLEVLLKDPEKAFWDGARLSFYRKFRKEMEANPTKKFYGLWSVEDLIKESTIDPPTHQDIDNQAHAMEGHNTLDRLHEIKHPVLLLAASHDRLTPKSVMEEMHERLPNSKLIVIDKAGHDSPLSRAPEVNKHIIEFLEN
ncbi:MAG: alpha/beta fold hydrolase [Promethearchaeota archaeon]